MGREKSSLHSRQLSPGASRGWSRLGLCLLACVLAPACIEFDTDVSIPDGSFGGVTLPDGITLDGGSLVVSGDASLEDILAANGVQVDLGEVQDGRALGNDCSKQEPCRPGLLCEDSVCVGSGETAEGESCVISAECSEGQCVDSKCVSAGEGEAGTPCESAADCAAGLRCGVVGFAAECLPEGDQGLTAKCDTSNDCASGLACADGVCIPVPGAPPAVPLRSDGVTCEAPSDTDIRAYFEVPGAPDAQEGDFFRLPYPNDIRTDESGRVDVSDFPTLGVNPAVGVDAVALYVDAVNGMRGFGTDSTVSFRFSGAIDFKSLDADGVVRWADITDPNNSDHDGFGYRVFTGRTKYACQNTLTVRRQQNAAMEPGHTYAVWLSSAVRTDAGDAVLRAENFDAMLSDKAPSNNVLGAAYDKYAPFRAYLAAQAIQPDEILVAAVFTVGPVRDLMQQLNQTAREQSVPKASNWVLCDKGVTSPCPQAEEGRACGTASSVFDEYHTLIELPIFQQGEPPYLEEGGRVNPSAPVRTEKVCAALTVPKGDMPEAGWPLVVFAHGTGGSFRSHIRDEVAGVLSQAETADGPMNFAVLGYDQVEHGPRRGDSDADPDNLFFNFLNPDAAQGNPLQGAVDVIAMGRFASSLSVSASESGGQAIDINPDAIVFFGHSQGSMHGSLAIPLAPEYQAAVLSGNGASLMHALLSKRSPVDIAASTPLAIGDMDADGKLPGGDHHPVLSLIQQYIDPADPLNFARQIAKAPFSGQPPHNVFQTYGQEDTFSPGLTMRLYAKAAELTVARAHSSVTDPDNLGTESPDFPVTVSFGRDGKEYTAAVRQYAPSDGSDGHFVAFDVRDANTDVVRFLAMAAAGMTPQVGE